MSRIPEDLNQCQAEQLSGSFMTLGPRSYVRCTNKPDFIATEKSPGADGLMGSMSLCSHCREIMEKKMPGRATFTAVADYHHD